ncbi:MAG: DUF2243 domain-containing protein [bacterium]|nr:DUF2243 domain-containing protein [bacterium]
MERTDSFSSRRMLIRAGTVVGFGLGGMLDGIILHQLLQWHHLVSIPVPPNDQAALEQNIWWDGVFHAAMYGIVALGLILMVRAVWESRYNAPFRPLFGAVLIGVGIFHGVDSILNHWVLQIHHIRMVENWLIYDLGYLGIGLVAFGIGWRLIRTAPLAQERA